MSNQTKTVATSKLTDIIVGVNKELMKRSWVAAALGAANYLMEAVGNNLPLVVSIPTAGCGFDVEYVNVWPNRSTASEDDYKIAAVAGATWQVHWLYEQGVRFQHGHSFRTFISSSKFYSEWLSGSDVDASQLKQQYQCASQSWVAQGGIDWTEELRSALVYKRWEWYAVNYEDSLWEDFRADVD